jgi:hypothetical protein
LPLASRFAPNLKSDSEYNNIFDEVEANLFVIDRNEDGLCSFAYFGSNNNILCSLHSVAIELHIPSNALKPKSCVLWPLALAHCYPLCLSVDDNAFLFPCNTKDNLNRSLCPSIANIIKATFGKTFLETVKQKYASEPKNK